MNDDRSLPGTINVAEVAISENDYHTAEDALLAALSDVRRLKSENRKEETHAD